MIDGAPISEDTNPYSIHPEDVQDMNFLKGSSAIVKYGKRSKYVVVLIAANSIGRTLTNRKDLRNIIVESVSP